MVIAAQHGTGLDSRGWGRAEADDGPAWAAAEGRPVTGMVETIGGTPLVELTRIFAGTPMRVFGKVEGFNPGGSIKDRSALNLIWANLRSGRLVPGRSIVVESSSGNLAIGLAQVCRYFGLKFVGVVDPRTSREKLAVLRAFGAVIDCVDTVDSVTGEYLSARIRRVKEIIDSTPDAFWPNQYANELNSLAHERTMHEITTALDGRVDYLFCATSSGGTLRGCASYVRSHDTGTQVIAVDAEGSGIFRPATPVRRLIPGHGAAHRPPLLDGLSPDRVIYVSDADCVAGCRALVEREALLTGGSSGGVVAAADRIRTELPADSVVVLVFPDRGEGYLDTIYSDDWLAETFGPHTPTLKGSS